MANMDASKLGGPEFRIRFPRKSVTILRAWFNEHRGHPYPTEAQKNVLQEQTKLSIKQISYWFINARRRNKTNLSPQDDEKQQRDWSAMNSLDRWRFSPLESEPASFADIASAIANAGFDNTTSVDDTCSNPSLLEDQSLDSRSTQTEPSIYWSMNSDTTYDSRELMQENWGMIKGRHRKQRQLRNGWSSSKDVKARKYQCTFCTDCFKTKYDWTRHESTQHLSFERWTCALSGPRIQLNPNEAPICSFCEDSDTSETHLASHRYAECAEKPISARTFFRSDHLRQHLHQFHGISGVRSSLLERYRSTLTQIHCRCGFCDEEFDEWSIRNDHIANHFRSGSIMRTWKGSLGLDVATLALVRNSTLPPSTNSGSVSADTLSCCSDVVQSIEDPPSKDLKSGSDNWHFRHPRFNYLDIGTIVSAKSFNDDSAFDQSRLLACQNELGESLPRSCDFEGQEGSQRLQSVHGSGEAESSAIPLQDAPSKQCVGVTDVPAHEKTIEDLIAAVSPPPIGSPKSNPEHLYSFYDSSVGMLLPCIQTTNGHESFESYAAAKSGQASSMQNISLPSAHDDEDWLSLLHFSYDGSEQYLFDPTQGP